jgi:hypothetical protein
VLVADGDGTAQDRILAVRGRRVRELFRGPVDELLSAGGRAFVVTGADLRRIDPVTGRAPRVAKLLGGVHRAFTIAPDGSAVTALESGTGDWTARLIRPAAGRTPRLAQLPEFTRGALTWLRSDRLLLAGDGEPFRLFDRRLRQLQRMPAGFAPGVRLVAARAGTAYGVDGDQLVAASLPGLTVRRIADLPTSEVAALEPIPRGARPLRASASAARDCPRER